MSQTPSISLPSDPRDWLDLYLDGLLSPSDRAAFERLAAQDPSLRAQVDLQARLDASIRHAYRIDAPPAPAPSTPREAAPAPQPMAPLARLAGLRLAAAVVVLVAAGAGGFWWHSTRTERALSRSYADDVARGLAAAEPCSSPEEFARYVREHLGTDLSLRLPEGLTLIGWDRTHRVFSDDTVTLFARYKGEPFVVYLDRASADREVPDRIGGCPVSKKLAGGVMIVEVRTASTPCFLARFDAPAK